MTTIGDAAFYGCSGFNGSLTIPNSVTTIGERAFYNCSGFTGDLKIPDSVNAIKDYAFDGCCSFTGSLTIPNSVTEVGKYAFRDCRALTGLVIGKNVRLIGDEAWYNCENMETIECLAEEPCEADFTIFACEKYFLEEKATLVVPKGCLEKYKAVTPWCYFIAITDRTPIPVMIITMSENLELEEGLDFKLVPTITPAYATNKYIGWSSSDWKVVSVDYDGWITAIKPGTAIITATTSNKLTATCKVTVIAKPSGIEDIDGDSKTVRVENGEIVIDGEGKAEIFNISGVRVAVSNGGRVSGLPKGIYLVRSNGKTVKLRL